MSESLHSQGYHAWISQDTSHMARPMGQELCCMGCNTGFRKPEVGQPRVKHWWDLVQTGVKEGGLKKAVDPGVVIKQMVW